MSTHKSHENTQKFKLSIIDFKYVRHRDPDRILMYVSRIYINMFKKIFKVILHLFVLYLIYIRIDSNYKDTKYTYTTVIELYFFFLSQKFFC